MKNKKDKEQKILVFHKKMNELPSRDKWETQNKQLDGKDWSEKVSKATPKLFQHDALMKSPSNPFLKTPKDEYPLQKRLQLFTYFPKPKITIIKEIKKEKEFSWRFYWIRMNLNQMIWN